MSLESRDISALRAIRKGPLRVQQPSPERIERLAGLGLVKVKNKKARLTVRGYIAVWRAKSKKR